MAETDKAAERSILILQFGRVLAPVIALAERTTPPTATEYRIAAATFRPDVDRWANEVSRFVQVGGYRFEHEYNDILQSPYRLCKRLGEFGRDTSGQPAAAQNRLKELLHDCQASTLAAIDRVPIDWLPQLLEGNTPFAVYLKLRDAIGTAKRRIHYFDRYLNEDFFPLYLRGADRSLEIRLVTTRGNHHYGITNVVHVSRLAGLEFAVFKLLECAPQDLHDRNLRIDDHNLLSGDKHKGRRQASNKLCTIR